jgi:5-methylcytosine-specific restriction endonuclease McrA
MPSIVRTRSIAYHRQAGRCFYCLAPMWIDDPSRFAEQHAITLDQASRLRCTAEHLRARRDGGDDSPENIVAACWHCNNARHRRKLPLAPTAYRNTVRARMAKRKWQRSWFFARGSLTSAALGQDGV